MFRSFLDHHHQGAMFKHGVVAACHVVWEYAVESAAG